MNGDLARKNARLGWLLSASLWIPFAGTFGIAFVYLAFD